MDAERRRAFAARTVAAGLTLMLTLTLMGLSGSLGSPGAMAQEPKGPDRPPELKIFKDGPMKGDLGTVAQIDVPEGFVFTGVEGTRKFLEMTENPVGGKEVAVLAPESLLDRSGDGWFIVFDFDPIGYVRDNDSKDLNAETAATILESIRKGTEASNEERKRRGWTTVNIVGWEKPPFYDPASHNLVWGIRSSSTENGKTGYGVNYNTRILGRRGVLEANLVVSPERLQSVIPTLDKLVKGITFKKGESYGEMRAGDKIAEYGLIGLITGGGIAVALKTGILTKFLKPILIGIVAVVAAVGKAFKSLFGGRSSEK